MVHVLSSLKDYRQRTLTRPTILLNMREPVTQSQHFYTLNPQLPHLFISISKSSIIAIPLFHVGNLEPKIMLVQDRIVFSLLVFYSIEVVSEDVGTDDG
jgi:hypothetical protein